MQIGVHDPVDAVNFHRGELAAGDRAAHRALVDAKQARGLASGAADGRPLRQGGPMSGVRAGWCPVAVHGIGIHDEPASLRVKRGLA